MGDGKASLAPLAALGPHKKRGARTRVIVDNIFISTCRDGPAVSLKGSPTVSPTTAAPWVGFLVLVPSAAVKYFPPWAPVSMYFFALSQAPPALFKKSAMRMPAM